MFISKEDYKKVSDQFFKFHHGAMVKLTTPHRKNGNEIFGFILRCEANANDKKLLVFSFISPVYYSKLISSFSEKTNKHSFKPVFKSIKEVKYYGMKRVLEKWKNIKNEFYLNYKDIKDNDFIQNINSDLMALKNLYDVIHYDLQNLNNDEIRKTSDYILKEFRMIEKYYKDINDIKVIFL